MAKDFDLIAELRDGAGTSNSRRLRRSGMVPAVIYGAGRENLSLIIDHNHLLKKLASESFLTSILSIKIQDKEESVLIKDVQIHPSKRQVMHLDMQRVIADQILRVSVPIHFLNGDSAPGVKLEGGTVSALMNEVEVSCLPKNLPERLEVDVAAMELDELLYLSDIPLAEGVEIPQLTQEEPNNEPIVAIRLLRIQEEEPEEVVVEGEEGEEVEGAEATDETTESEGDNTDTDSEDNKHDNS
ncbi:MAG TPA: 50S ribosomal protein L25/general stress protein Ctc [Gammaproteobacteria bacterium]|nr:50S ribosomal protein L25/general stress protein Ctc [Gammaproteobacteria bacterium]